MSAVAIASDNVEDEKQLMEEMEVTLPKFNKIPYNSIWL